jgi:hypothetical protein
VRRLSLVALAAIALWLSGCAGTAPDATVIVDDQPVGPLRVVTKHGLALPPGRHRITVEKNGYFPYDAAIDATGEPIVLDVALTKIPE